MPPDDPSRDATAHPAPDERAVAVALRTALRTNRHAQWVFDMVKAGLGRRACLHLKGEEGGTRVLYRVAEADSICPWPVLEFSTLARGVIDLFPDMPKVEVPVRDEVPPAIQGLGPGHVRLFDGPHSLEVVYRDDGLWKETSRHGPAETLAGLLPVLAEGQGPPAERVAAFVLGLDPLRHGPGRAHMPVSVPTGPQGIWHVGRRALREALHERRLPADAGVIVADGVQGKALAHGPTLEDAREALLQQLTARTPRPPESGAPSGPRMMDLEPWSQEARAFQEALDDQRKRLPVEWPDLTPQTVPWVSVALEACPRQAHPWGQWTRLLGPHGESTFALQQFRPDGFTIVGAHLVDALDLDGLEAALDEADSRRPPLPHEEGEAWRNEEDPFPCKTTRYQVRDPRTGAVHAPQVRGSNRAPRFGAGTLLDGAILADHVIRQQWFWT